MPNRNLTAILWDLDGTLIDTAPDLAAAANAMRAERGLDPLPLSQLRNMASFGARGMLARGLEVDPDDMDYDTLRKRYVALYAARMTQDSKPFAGVRDVIRQLADAGLTWGIVTNKVEHLARPIVEKMAFQPPPACVVGGDSASQPKPHPAPLLLACEQTGIDPANCCYIGDSDRDIDAGRAAGMYTVAAAYGYIDASISVADWGADAVISDVCELTDVLAPLLQEKSIA